MIHFFWKVFYVIIYEKHLSNFFVKMLLKCLENFFYEIIIIRN